MRKEYDFSGAQKNPYASRLKRIALHKKISLRGNRAVGKSKPRLRKKLD